MKRLFISDLHLEEARPDILRAFLQLLAGRAQDSDELYILGDFFEAWVGDDDDRPLIQNVASALQKLSNGGTRLYLMQGNRDFLLGEAFCQRVGATLLPDPSVIDMNGEPCLLMHGDSLCIDDEQYMAFRQQARSAAWQDEVLARPLEERRALARQLRMASSEANSNKAEDIMDVSPGEVRRVMAEHGCRRLIHGHTHRPARHRLDIHGASAERIVLGDWDQRGWLLETSPQGINLESFPL